MESNTRLVKWGTSFGVRIPKPFLEAAQLRPGEKVTLELEDGAIVIRPTHRRPHLQELVKAITAENRHIETDWGAFRGNEVW